MKAPLSSASRCAGKLTSPAAMVAQLYVTPTSCGAASFIAASRAGLIGRKVEASIVNIENHVIQTGPNKGTDFYQVKPKGNVATLILDDGTLVNENAACLTWIADQNPEAGLAPSGNARYLLLSKLSYIASEVHASISPLFNPTIDPVVKEAVLAKLRSKFDYLTKQELAGGKKFIVGESFTVADSYLYIVLSWLGYIGLNLSKYPSSSLSGMALQLLTL